MDGAEAGRWRSAQGAAAAAALVGVLAGLDAFLPRRYTLIAYYGLAPLVASASLAPAPTSAVGAVAITAALLVGQFSDGDAFSSGVLLRTGVVVASSLIAIYVSAKRVRRERNLRAISAVADTAQSAVLRDLPPSLDGITLASAYHSASAQARVGGDFFEALRGPAGTRFLIGDVRGKGLPAVQLAGTVVGAFRHAALSEPDLGRLARSLDATVAYFAGYEDFVTAILMEAPDPDTLRLVCCGHHPPLVGAPGAVKPAHFADIGLPLGMGGGRIPDEIPWTQGELLLLYTDGLVEARNRAGEMLSLETICAAVREPDAAGVTGRIVQLVNAHTGGKLDDDLALLVAYRQLSPA